MKEIRKLLALNLAFLLLLSQALPAMAVHRGEEAPDPSQKITLRTDREMNPRMKDEMTFSPQEDGYYYFILIGNGASCGNLRFYQDGKELPQVYGEDVYSLEQAKADGFYSSDNTRLYTKYMEKKVTYTVEIKGELGILNYLMVHSLYIKKAPSGADLTLIKPETPKTPARKAVPLQLEESVDFESNSYSFTPEEDGYYRFQVEADFCSCPYLSLYNNENKQVDPYEVRMSEGEMGPRVIDYELSAGVEYKVYRLWPWYGVDFSASSQLTVWKVSAQGDIIKTEKKVLPSVTEVFSDIKEKSWYREAVQYVYDEGIMQGVKEDRFDPEEPSSRGTLLTMLYRMEGEPAVSGKSFSDVPNGAWYEKAVTWAAANEIATGYEDGSFRPEAVITREQLATILYRYAEQKGYDVTGREDVDQFSDAKYISAYAKTAISWAKAVGVITGSDWGGVSPSNTATRAEVAAMLMRFCENVKK